MKAIYKVITVATIILVVAIIVFCLWRFEKRDYTKTFDVENDIENVETIHVATYNVKILNNGNDLDKAIEDLKPLDLDIICLQEVDKNSLRSKDMDMVKEIADGLGMDYYYFYKSMWLLDGHYGLGIISKYPIQEVSSQELPTDLFSEPRVLAKAEIVVGDEIINVYNTHLTWKSWNYHTDQIEYIKEHIGRENTILMGDFNAYWDENKETVLDLNQMNHDLNPYITFRGVASPDNIFYTDDFEMIESGMIETSFSDHNSLNCVLRIVKE